MSPARLLLLAGLFLVLYATAITLAPAAPGHVPGRLTCVGDIGHPCCFWIALALAAHFLSARWLPDRDPYLIPIAALFSGWGPVNHLAALPRAFASGRVCGCW